MAETTIPDTINELLEPVNADSPVGEELDMYVGAYEMLSYQFNGAQTDYEACAMESAKVLKESSKHLQVAVWLSLSWLMEKDIAGYRDGLRVFLGLIQKHEKNVFPLNAKHRLAALKYLSREKWIQTLLKKVNEEQISDKGQIVNDIKALLQDIALAYEQTLGVESPKPFEVLEKLNAVEISMGSSTPNVSSTPQNGELNKESPKAGSPEIEHTDTGKTENNLKPELPPSDNPEPEDASPEDAGTEIEEIVESEIEAPQELKESIEIDDVVLELLEDISFSSKAGIDIEREPSEDDLIVYEDLKSEMRSFTGNDYNKCIELCTDILQNRSKHLRVAVLLTICWYKTKGVEGLRNGLVLLDQLLHQFEKEVFPLDSSKRIKIIQRLNSEPRLQKINETAIGDEQAEYVVTDDKIRLLNDVDKSLEHALHKLKGEDLKGEPTFLNRLKEALGDRLKEAVGGKEASDKQLRAFNAHFQVVKPGRERIQYVVEQSGINALEAVGIPAPIVDGLKELIGNQYAGWARCSDALGLAIGEENAQRYSNVLAAFFNGHIIILKQLQQVYAQLVNTCKEKLNAEYAWLESLGDMLAELNQRSEAILSEAVQELQQSIKEKPKTATQSTNSKRPQNSTSERSSDRAPIERRAPSGEGHEPKILIRDIKITSSEDADRLLKKVLKFYVEEEKEETPASKPEVPLDTRFYGLSRTYKWGHLGVPPADGVIKAPEKTIQTYYTNPPANIGTKEFVRKFELLFLNNDTLLYWLDGQRAVVEALEKLGEEGEPAAEEVKLHIAKLLLRFPALPGLHFNDNETTFASPETQEWLKAEVIGKWGGGAEKILPPLLGEDYQEINEGYAVACEALPDGFNEHALKMQQAIKEETRQRGKFLIKLNLANYYSLANQHEIARAKFNGLLNDIDACTISEWEPALCVSMWRSAFLNNKKLLETDINATSKAELEKQQTVLFELIASYDGVLAHSLIEYTQE